MGEREGFDAQHEAKRETAGPTSEETRERIWSGLVKYLSVEAAHARKAARAETEKGRGRRGS